MNTEFVYIGKPGEIDAMMASSTRVKSLFKFGNVRATPALTFIVSPQEAVHNCINHCTGQWGLVDGLEAAANNHAVEIGARIKSRYKTRSGVPFLIITEADRSATTIMLEKEYANYDSP